MHSKDFPVGVALALAAIAFAVMAIVGWLPGSGV